MSTCSYCHRPLTNPYCTREGGHRVDVYRRGQTVYVTDPLAGTGRLEATVMLDRGDGYVTVWLEVQQRAVTVPAKRLTVPLGAR